MCARLGICKAGNAHRKRRGGKDSPRAGRNAAATSQAVAYWRPCATEARSHREACSTEKEAMRCHPVVSRDVTCGDSRSDQKVLQQDEEETNTYLLKFKHIQIQAGRPKKRFLLLFGHLLLNITNVFCAKKRMGHACICPRMVTGYSQV